MAFTKGAKILTAVGGVAVLAFLVVPKIVKASNALANIVFDVEFSRLHSFKSSVLKLSFNSIVKNLAGFSITIENLFVNLESSKDGKSWENFGGSPERISKVIFTDNKTTKTPIIIDIKLAKLLTALVSNHKYRFIVNYDLAGIQNKYIVKKDIAPALKEISKKIGLSGPDAPLTTKSHLLL